MYPRTTAFAGRLNGLLCGVDVAGRLAFGLSLLLETSNEEMVHHWLLVVPPMILSTASSFPFLVVAGGLAVGSSLFFEATM